jgi:hypothetical protein
VVNAQLQADTLNCASGAQDFRHNGCPASRMGRLFSILWLLALLAIVVMLGQTSGLYDVPALRDLQYLLPLTRPQAEATPPLAAPPAPAAATAASPTVARTTVPSTTDECTSGSPRFVHGAASLKAALGGRMGDATECERLVDPAGNTEQKTTTGLFYYRVASNTVAFTNGFDHWALTARGLVHWSGDDVEPPPNAQPAS